MDSSRVPEQLDAVKARAELICKEYGLYGTAYSYTTCDVAGLKQERLYIVASPTVVDIEQQKGEMNPRDIVQSIGRNEQLFYPNAWAIDITDGHDMSVYEQLVDYCQRVEFLSVIYAEYGLRLPAKIRISEIEQLKSYADGKEDSSYPFEVREKCRKDLDWFFKRERSGGFRRKWLDYFRSDKFPDDKGPVARILGYLRRNKSEIPLEKLMEINSDVKKLEMQEYEYKLFATFMQQCYPEVSYSVGNKEIVNHGLDRPGQPPLMDARRITSEEFAVIRKERFAEDGWDCLANVKMSYWEFRDIYFKEIDEPQIAAAYQAISLVYAKPDDLSVLQRCGDLELAKISSTDFMNFVSLAKANGLRFYIDKLGQFDEPCLDYVTVVFNRSQQQLLEDITARMISDKITGSHFFDRESRLSLQERITNAQQIPGPKKKLRRSMSEDKELE